MQNVDFANGYKKKPEKPADPDIGDVKVIDQPAGDKGGAQSAYARAIGEQNRILMEQQALAERQRKAALDATIKANNKAADKSLREAYIANMLSKKNLPQQLKAVGVSGGASETTLADIQNTYMNNRFGIEEQRNEANAQARQAYNAGVAGDYNNFLTKQYELQGTLADNLRKMGSSSAAAEPQSVKGYKIDSMGITATSEADLFRKLVAGGLTQEQAEQYLIRQGIILPNPTVGGSYR